ncbi:MAG: hypothetical protein MUC62_01695 [Candidatus Thermoplasmatota archaeon]|jgi:hypothetical protein|nr:hypothetical protein [Candidatus Thermoplasmatota archaeon]
MSLKRNDTIVGSMGAGVFLVMMVAAFVGGADIVGPSTPVDGDGWWVDQILVKGTDSDSGELTVGTSRTKELESPDKVIRTINATITWTDETNPPARRVRRHENQPDAFTLIIESANRTVTGSGSNPQGGEGRIDLTITFTDEELMVMGGAQNISITVTMDSAGMWVPNIGIGAIGLRDDGNVYDLMIDYDYYQMGSPAKEEQG